MGIADLIDLCTLSCWACDFSEVIASEVAGDAVIPTAAIDGNCWLYECACGIASGLDVSSNYSSFKEFAHRYQRRLQYVKKCGWQIILVFDGRRLPVKSITHQKRAAARKKAASKTTAGNDLSTFKPSHELIHRLVIFLRKDGHDIIIAPHEGDPQCAFLSNTEKAQIVITRDSDLIAHGVKCVFFWNSVYHPGFIKGFGGKLYWKASLWRCAKGLWKPIIKLGWEAFLAVCVMVGTDYNRGIKQIGIKRAVAVVAECKTLADSVKYLKDPGRTKYRNALVPEGFLEDARKAIIMFRHPLVFDPHNNTVCHAVDPPAPLIKIGAPNWMGRVPISREEALRIARSEINPDTLKPYPAITTNDRQPQARRRTSRRPCPNRIKPVPVKRKRVMNEDQWKHLLLSHGIDFDIPQVLVS